MKAVYDTCVYIDFLRKSMHEEIFYDRTMFRFLSPIVVMELRAGAHASSDIKTLDRLFSPYSRAGRIISLPGNIFIKAGEIIQKVHRTYGGLSHGFSHDVLIALSAASIGATVFTTNKNDFEKIALFVPISLQIL